MLPSGTAVKNYIEEMSHLIKLWINNISLRNFAWMASYVMPALLFQKLSKSSKSKEMLLEGQTMQERLKSPNSSMTITKILMKFRILMSKGNVNSALKLLNNNNDNNNKNNK